MNSSVYPLKNTNSHYLLLNTTIMPLCNGKISLIFCEGIVLFLSQLLLLVILGFTRLTSLCSSVSLSNLGFTRLNSVNVSVSSESLCNPQFDSVELGLSVGYFQCNFYSVNTRFMLTKEWFLVNFFGHTRLNLTNC